MKIKIKNANNFNFEHFGVRVEFCLLKIICWYIINKANVRNIPSPTVMIVGKLIL